MAFKYLTNLPLEEGAACFLDAVRNTNGQLPDEWIPTGEADGRIMARPVYAQICAPHYNACAMDGIALRAAKTFGATETTPVLLAGDEYIPVDTGDALPKDCDAVVMIEDVVWEEEQVRLYAAAVPWQHVRQIGEDLCAGDMVLPAYTAITPAAQGALLAGGVGRVNVIRTPVVGFIPTGDELVCPGKIPGDGDIIEFNSTIFSSMMRRWGSRPRVYPIVRDSPREIEAALKKAVSECDVVLLGAGSSAGRDDYSAECMGRVGTVLFHGLAIKPGKPAAAAMAGRVPVLGVPGYPVSAILVLEHLLRPVLDWLCGRGSREEGNDVPVVMARKITSSLKYREFVRARAGLVEGKIVAVPLSRGAGVVSSFVKADAILDIPQNREGYEAGEKACARLLRSTEEISRTLVITGSHDPLIDEAASIYKEIDRNGYVASSHVGSMGGIFALKRREAHMAGIHLLCGMDGSYNTEALRSAFSPEEVALVRGVGRIQGIMVEKGNPKGIRDIRSLAHDGIRYVNRQGGSGTRILFDYLCGRRGMNVMDIEGYMREEYTHTAVAAQIGAGTADAGLGILSAARIYGLDFIPICNECYDFAVLKSALELPQYRAFLQVLKSEELKARLMEMGGYIVENIGEVVEWGAGNR